MPLRRLGTVLEAAATRRCIASQLARDRRRRSSKLPGDRSDAFPARTRKRNLFTLSEG
jgi:hypothetical protein